ncbi:hypothetical protein GCM10007301_42720 [Azorhizobium oxalatiphilum]|uniref:Uncharacterized protein n=1 Tax=Azorhizobium oxalatiphilum TaxID=980631 RepID=A0A917C966_9HYPH|nr:hypothetical protein [Azorhizobium oxalatiphilum]GGF78185.1 hypothetical protein GCM10007301_42720 [Azorhizobium oxalatiphilum]
MADHTKVDDVIDKVSGLIAADAYGDAAREVAAFKAAHPGLIFFIEEALPSRVSDHVLKKTGAHVAFTTYTLRHPNWATEVAKAAADPDAFARLVSALEAELSSKQKAA